ncbi:MAG: RNA polymerase sigma factor [Phycicoccus sp.]
MGAGEWDELVERARAGEQGAWATLHERFTPLLRWEAAGYRLGTADVDDVVQMTWTQCVTHLDRLRDAQALPAWLRQVCRHEAWRLVRHQQRCLPVADLPTHAAPLTGDPAVSGEPTDRLVDQETMDDLRAAIDTLPTRQREVLGALLALEDAGSHTYARVSQVLSIPVGSIGPTRQRAVRRLRAELADRGSSVPGFAA